MSRLPTRTHKNRTSQLGLTFVLILVALLGIGGLLLFAGLSATTIQRATERSDAEHKTLEHAKQALLGYLLRATDGGRGYRLGNFLTPDVMNSAHTSIQYDGKTDEKWCLSATSSGFPAISILTDTKAPNQRCLGKVPWQNLGLDLSTTETNDPFGQVPWMAISANLNTWDTCLARLNSDLANWTVDSSAACPASGNTVPYPWLTVVDQNSNVLSNRVALVLIMPGTPIQTGSRTQLRTPANPGGPRDYLDTVSLPLGCVSSCVGVFDNAGLMNTFVQIPRGIRIPATAEDTSKIGQPIPFNDELIYLTVDDIIKVLEERVTSEMATAVRKFKADTGSYPWAADFISPNNADAFLSKPTKLVGLLPFFVGEAGGTPPGGYPTFPTRLDWTVAGLPNPSLRDCQQVQSGPARWINTLQGITSAVGAAGSLDATTTKCTWKGRGGLSCDGTIPPTTLSRQYAAYKNKPDCNNDKNGVNTNFSLDRSISVAISSTCRAPTVQFTPASATDVARWDWACDKQIAASTFNIEVKDVFSTSPGATGAHLFAGGTLNVAARNMRYQPPMPYWFYENDWYKTAFYALPRAAASGASADCGAAGTLTLGTRTINTPIVQLAGRNLTGNTRPSSLLTDYLESANATGVTDCKFEDSGKKITNTYNDQIRIVTP